MAVSAKKPPTWSMRLLATDAIFVVFAVVASLIAFLSLLHFINAVIAYLGGLVDIEDLSLDASIFV